MPKDSGNRPEDLISAKEAGVMSGKSKVTIRSWVRKGKLTGYRLDPDNKMSTLMISKQELLTYLAVNAKPNHPNNSGRSEAQSVSLVEKEKEIHELKNQLEIEREKVKQLVTVNDDIKTLTDTLQRMLESRDNQVKELTSTLSTLLSEQVGLRQDNRRLTAYISLPWWKKMSSFLLLEDKS